MPRKTVYAFVISTLTALPALAVELKPLMLVTDQVVYQDDFAKSGSVDKQTWRIAQGTQWVIADGVLRGKPSTPEFQAARPNHKGLEPRIGLSKCPLDYVAHFKVRYIGGLPAMALPSYARVPSIDIGHHVGRLEFGLEGARLMGEGETLQLASAPDYKLQDGKWYEVLVEARGDEVVVQFQDGPTFHGKHPSLLQVNHNLAFVGTQAGTVEVDDVTVWSVKPEPSVEWAANLAKLPAQEMKSIRTKRPGYIEREKKAAEAKAEAK